ncbi:hypothetical protein EVAR_32640_1 [Eumeta japonica]|uniref:Uncharacterized protein n=1 Tax=Eumeta variegata TaxID=151549 RepID=A0A4C1WTP0_EUMVA|nr:hypothetical protein EVAR_32640_1 [Eumeta japonica]
MGYSSLYLITCLNVQEQERACNQQRSAREAEQERQWKQLQQLRQQQTQQQQQIIHDQRVQAMQRMRTVDGSADVTGPEGGAPRSTFPAQRFPLHYSNNEDINRQLRDLLQRHPDKMWPPQSQSEEGLTVANIEGQPFRQPLPVGARPRPPLLPGQRPDQHHAVPLKSLPLFILLKFSSNDSSRVEQNVGTDTSSECGKGLLADSVILEHRRNKMTDYFTALMQTDVPGRWIVASPALKYLPRRQRARIPFIQRRR